MRSNFRKFLFAVFFHITFATQIHLSGLEFEVIDLGTLSTDHSEALCINDVGQICGFYRFQGEKQFFLWDPKIGLSCLDFPVDAEPIKINSQGQIIGRLPVKGSKLHGFFWDPASGFIDIGTLGGDQTWVKDINDHGQVVGYSDTGTCQNQDRHAFLWENGIMVDLGSLSGDLCLNSRESGAVGINNEGLIVGYSEYGIVHRGKKPTSGRQAVIWKNGHIQRFEVPNSKICSNSQILSVNNNMQTLYLLEGKCYVKDLASGHDFKLPYSFTEGAKLKDNGNCVGLRWVLSINKEFKSFHILPNPNIKHTIWRNISCHKDINNSNWIVGVGSTIYNEQHAVLLRPISTQEIETQVGEPIPFSKPKIGLYNELSDILIKYGNNSEELSPIHYAIKTGAAQVVETLLQHGADVNAKDSGITALHRAILADQFEIARLLLDNGADITLENTKEDDSKWSAIHYAAEIGNADIINLLIERGADMNANSHRSRESNNKFFCTPLHIAVKFGNYEAVVALVNKGADVNRGTDSPNKSSWIGDREGGPLDMVISNHLKESDNPKLLDVVKFLVENGARRRYVQYEYIVCPVIRGYLQSKNR